MYCFTVSFVESQWSNGTGGDAENFSCEHWRDKALRQGREENISLSIWGDHWVYSAWLVPKIWRNPLRMRPQRKIVRTHALLFCKVVEAFFCNGSAEECASCKTLGGFLLKAPLNPLLPKADGRLRWGEDFLWEIIKDARSPLFNEDCWVKIFSKIISECKSNHIKSGPILIFLVSPKYTSIIYIN